MNRRLRLNLTTAPSIYPVSLGEAKAQLRLTDDETEDEALILSWIDAATEVAQTFTGRQLITATYTMFMDDWPQRVRSDNWWDGVREGAISELLNDARDFDLPRPPLQSVTSISTFDDDDTETTYAATNYFVDTASEPGRVVLRRTATAPVIDRVANGLKVVFVAGYGDKVSDVPQPIRDGILRTIAWLDEHRGDDCEPEMAARNSGAQALWQQYRIVRL